MEQQGSLHTTKKLAKLLAQENKNTLSAAQIETHAKKKHDDGSKVEPNDSSTTNLSALHDEHVALGH